MYYLIEAATKKLVAKQIVPFSDDYLNEMAASQGCVLEVISSVEENYRAVDKSWTPFVTPSIPQGLPA